MDNYIVSYDLITDVLYIITHEKLKATKTILDDDYIAIRKTENKICGITIDGYKDRHINLSWKDSFITKYFPDFNINTLPKV